ncbi:MAG: ATP-dependent DNA helicase RecQ [Bacteroidota bacterium]|nr:ATP-dependent DNA helicase RecQ [Bacteroidota bacterium]
MGLDYKKILTKYWGYPDFRPGQAEIIRAVGDHKKDTLGLLPTGGGKSIIFQVPTLAQEGLALVITPLIALMKDQVENLNARDIKAAAVYSGMTRKEIDITLNNAVFNAYKFLYLSPERLGTDLFKERVKDMNISLIAIDEAHCISQWGYDFRPSYLNIADIRKLVPDVPFLALTATATPEVADDIQEKLEFKENNLFRQSFRRENLIYVVRNVEDKNKYLLRIAHRMQGTGIVYVRNRRKTRETAQLLSQNGISADYFHAGIEPALKDSKQAQWKNDKIRVIVSTNAFGMGIDKPDVRFVVHLDLPDSPEAYFQEAGRGGRDGKKAYAILLYNKTDKINIDRRTQANFPKISFIKKVYHSLFNFFEIPVGAGKGTIRALSIKTLAQNFKLPIFQVYSSMKFLKNEGYMDFTEQDFAPSKVNFIIRRDDLYKFQIKQSKFDPFIKMLLRTYSGVFSNYVSIDEAFLAKKAQVKPEVINNYLEALHGMEVIKYIPQRKTPFIVFTEERLEKNNIKISKENYQEAKDRYMKRMNAMLHYAESTAKCRSQILLAYFGEKDTVRCGECDVCSRRNELNLSTYEFDLILQNIKGRLQETELSLEKVVDACNSKENKVIKVIRWLLDNKKIEYTKDKKLKWSK